MESDQTNYLKQVDASRMDVNPDSAEIQPPVVRAQGPSQSPSLFQSQNLPIKPQPGPPQHQNLTMRQQMVMPSMSRGPPPGAPPVLPAGIRLANPGLSSGSMSQRPTLIAPSRPDGNIQESPRLAHPHMHVGVGLPVQVRQPPVAPPTLKPVVPLPSGIARPPPINNPKPEPFAKLSLTCIKGMDIKAGQGLNVEADPYVILKLGDQECISKPDNKGGKNPVWNQEFDFDIVNEKELQIEVYDKQAVATDKFMGRGVFSILDWIASGSFEGNVELMDKLGKPAGMIALSAKVWKLEYSPVRPKIDTQEKKDQPGAARPPTLPQRQKIEQNVAKLPNEKSNSRSMVDQNGQAYNDEQILEAFRAFDLDKNNFIGAAEIKFILVNIGERVTDEEIDEMIRMVDRDGDGQVGFNEFYSLVTGGQKAPAGLARAKALDKNQRGSIIHQPQVSLGPEVMKARMDKRRLMDEFARDHHLKPESIKRAHRRFQAADKSSTGLLTYSQFCDILQVDPSSQCNDLFKAYDYEENGNTDAREILVALANFTGAGKEDKLKFSFMIYDEHGKGSISKAELTKILKANHGAKLDAEVMRRADTIMTHVDRQGTGLISYDDFVALPLKFPNLLFPKNPAIGS